MTTPSKENNVEQVVNNALDASISDNLPDSVQRDIANTRMRALNQAKLLSGAQPAPLVKQIKKILSVKVLVPSAVAVCALVLVNYSQNFMPESREIASIPPLPTEVLDESIPSEDLALLQDIEFATWLAAQEQQDQEAIL